MLLTVVFCRVAFLPADSARPGSCIAEDSCLSSLILDRINVSGHVVTCNAMYCDVRD
jgi:hypothetical protein